MMNKTHFKSQLHFWTHMLDEAFPEEAMLVEGKHWPEDYIKAATNMLKKDGKYVESKSDEDVKKIADRFRKVLHGNSPLGYFNTVVRWYSEDPKDFVKPLLDNGQVPDDKLESVLQQLLNFLNNQALVDKYSAQVKNGDMTLKDFSQMMKKISDEDKTRAANAKFTIKDNGYKVIPIMSYEELNSMFGGDATGYEGESEWCHTNGKSTYNYWTDNYTKFFFVIAKNNWKSIKPKERPALDSNAYDEYGLSLMAILVSREGELLKCTLRWNHVVEPSAIKPGRSVDRAFISFAELSQVTGLDVEAEVKKALEEFKRIPIGTKVYEGLEGICFARDHLYWYDKDFNPIDPPNEIDGGIDLYELESVTSLEGSPKIVNEYFYCAYTGINTLKGCPEEVGSWFACNSTDIYSLEGCPKKVGGHFDCSSTNISSLKGAPEEINGDFNCMKNEHLKSLEYSPKRVKGSFNCKFTSIASLKGSPREVGKSFDCDFTNITSLEGAPREVGGFLNCSFTRLASLKGAPAKIGNRISTDTGLMMKLKPQLDKYKEWLKTNPTENYPG